MNSAPIRFIQGDSTDVLLSLPPQSIDVIVTSPYYNIGTDYGSYKDSDPRQQYLFDMATWAIAVHRTLKENGSIFLNIDGKPTDPWVPFDVVNCFRDRFVLQNTFHWIKSIAVDDKTIGHYKPINSPRFVNQCHEYIFHLTKTGQVPLHRSAIGVPHTDPSNLKRWESAARDQRHCRGNCWLLPYVTKQKKGEHPAEFPVTLPEFCLRLHGQPRPAWREDFLVCDPFCGTGASAVACAQMGIRFLGIDINCLYLLEATRRVQELGVDTYSVFPLHQDPEKRARNDEMGRADPG